MICWFTFLLLLPFISASPLEYRENAALCDKYQKAEHHPYTVWTNHWGATSETAGSQCSTFESIHNEVVIWHTEWNWNGQGGGIKSFSNVELDVGIDRQLGAISSMKSIWHWSLKNAQEVVANVAFDLFTYDGANKHEVMIWIGNFNAEPISYHVNANGIPIAVASNLSLAGYSWNMYRGNNGQNEVFSFVPVNGNIRNFNGDVYAFFKYLMNDGKLSSSETLVTAQAGAEVTCGSAKLTSIYKLEVTTN